MQREKIQLIRDGLETAYVNGSTASELLYKPNFVSNNHNEGKKVLSVIEDELLKCDKFQISVAFITLGGVTPLLQTLKELEKREIPGEILTSNYLDFSEPQALEKLNSLKNIRIKMYDTNSAKNGFHTKGYIFKKEAFVWKPFPAASTSYIFNAIFFNPFNFSSALGSLKFR